MFRNKQRKRNLVVVLMVSIGFAGLLGEPGLAAADTIESVEVRITASDDYFETSPTLGSDDFGDMVVYTSVPLLPDGSRGPGEIACQRLDADGLTDGPVIQVSDGTTDDQLNDVSGPLIVYSAFLSTGTRVGQVKVFDLNSGHTETLIEDAATLFEARICGTAVVWTQGDPGGLKVMYYDLAWGTSLPVKIGGPNPPARNVDIGERFVVWEEEGTYQGNIKAYDHILGTTTTVSNDPDSDERQPATSGNWVVWEATTADGMTIELADISDQPIDRYTAVANHANTYAPSIDGDLVAYESDLDGNFDIFLYRISDGAGFQVTTQEDNQWLNNLFGNKVAYADDRNASRDIYVSTFSLPPDIDVSPAEYDFGEVELGTSSTVIITISNAGCGDLTVDSIEFAAGSSADFDIATVPSLPAVVAPDSTLADVVITYTPSAAGLASAVLNIGSNDPDEPLVAVSLSGTGVVVEPPPSEQIQATLDFFDASVDDGTLVGDGPGNSAENRLNALRNMIETAGDLIEDGLLDDACQQLQDVYKKTDGEPRPPDFVTGEAASELAILIQDLLTNIGCG